MLVSKSHALYRGTGLINSDAQYAVSKLSATTYNGDCDPQQEGLEYYKCLENHFKCGPKMYIQKTALKAIALYQALSPNGDKTHHPLNLQSEPLAEFSQNGVYFYTQATKCIAEKINLKLEKMFSGREINRLQACRIIESVSVAEHPSCYDKFKFCDNPTRPLGPNDYQAWELLVSIISPPMEMLNIGINHTVASLKMLPYMLCAKIGANSL